MAGEISDLYFSRSLGITVHHLLLFFAGDNAQGSTGLGMVSTGDAVFEAVGLLLESDAGMTPGDDGLDVGNVNRRFLFQTSALRILAASFYVAVDAVYAFNQDASGLGEDTQDSALLTLVVATEDYDDITFFYMGGHNFKPPQKPTR